MLTLPESLTVYLDTKSVDMRKSINGLSARVVDEFELSPQREAVFIFWNKYRDKVKLLFWDKNGFVLYYKRLERGKFKIPKQLVGDKIILTSDQLSWLLAGLDFHLMQEFSHLNYSNYY
tara:strand:- start:14 stop:370 length:357 start_codon:yes stop_codon:yes gene_type:complete